MHIARTGLDAQDMRMRVISNNLANVSTNGYKRAHAVFEDLMYQNLRQAGAASSEQTTLPTAWALPSTEAHVAPPRAAPSHASPLAASS